MSWTYTDEYYRQYTRDTWNESAPHYEPVRRNLDLANPALLRHAALRPGQRVLDVATGPGEPALTIARAVGASGRVLGVDLSERMVELARENAKRAGATKAEFQVMDAEKLELPDASFDAAVSRFGLQIVTNPEAAIGQMRRVLKPGGRFAATVWTTAEANPALHVIVGPMLEFAEPDETGYIPTPYEMGNPGELAKLLRDAGLRDVNEERVPIVQRYANVDEWLRGILQGTPLGHSLREEDEPVQQQVMRKTMDGLKRYVQRDGSLSMPAEFVAVSATR